MYASVYIYIYIYILTICEYTFIYIYECVRVCVRPCTYTILTVFVL